MDYQTLKARHRAEREHYSENLSLRVHRALSWLCKAEDSREDPDASFIFLWIAFNAAYANNLDGVVTMGEQKRFREYLKRIISLDREQRIYALLWEEFPSSIRVLLKNRYVFQPFWEFHSGNLSEQEWRDQFDRAQSASMAALGKRDTEAVLGIVFSRLYTLRNQLVHGGATWQGSANRDQIRDGTRLLGQLVPLVISLMMDGQHELWGDASYPVIRE